MSEKHKKVYENFLSIFLSMFLMSISALASLVDIFLDFASFTVGLKSFAMAAGVKKYISQPFRKKKKRKNRMLLAKAMQKYSQSSVF